MKEPRLEPDSPAHGVISYDARIAADTDVSASSYASTVSTAPLETLEVHDQPAKAQVAVPMTDSRFKTPFSRRKAAIVSSIITVLVIVLTVFTLAILSRETKQPNTSSRLNLGSQDIQLKNQSNATAPAELQGAGSAVLINGDLITRGQLKVANGAYVTVLRSANLTSNRNLTLPNTSGTLCVDSNNCGYATAAQLQDLQSRLGQIVVPNVPDATTVNALGGAVSIQGTSNQISVVTANGVIALSTPQDIAPISSPTFANLLLNGNFSVAGTVTLPLNCSGMLNGGALTTNASGQIICSADDSAGGGSSVSTPGGTAGRLALFTAADTIADSIISQLLGTITIGGNATITGSLSANSLTLATALSVANGGTGATTFTTNGVLLGNGTGAVTSTTAPTSGQVLLGNASNVPQFTTVSGDVVITAAGVTAIQADSVALGVDTTGNYVANLGTLTGLTTTGNTGEGSTPTLSVVYGSSANTSVQGNTSINVTAGTNLTGGGSITLGSGGTLTLNVTNSPTFSGNIIAQGGAVTIGNTSGGTGSVVLHDGNGQIGSLTTTDLTAGRTYTFPDATGTVCLSTGNCVGGSGGAPNGASYLTLGNDATLNNERAITAGNNIEFTDGGANGTFTIGTTNNPSFTTSVTTPLLQSSGALSITPSGALTVGATGQTALLQGSTTTITSNGVGNDIVLTSANNIRLTGFNCTTFANGGVLTTDASGNLVCANDDGGAGGAITGAGTSGRIALFTGSQSMADSWLLQNGSTLELDITRNLSLLGGNLSVTGTGSFSGLLTASGGLTITSGQTFTVNGDAFTDLTGNGLIISSGSLQTTLGTSVDLVSEITGTLGVTNGGTGVNGSSAANGQLLIGNGTGYTLATLTPGAGINITNAAGSITVASAFGTSIDLGVETTGNYQAGTTAGNGISVSGTPGGGWSPTIDLGALTSNWNQTGAFDIVLNNANSQLKVLESTGGIYFGSIDVGDLSADRTYTFPDASGTVCLSTGNCAGAGGGITGSGTTNAIAKFTGTGTLGDSSLSDSGSTVTINGTANLVIQGGTATFGTTTQAGTLTISDGSSNTVSLVASGFAANQTYTIPDVGGSATFCMSTGNCVGGGGGGAPNAAAYLVASLDGTLTSERALTAGSNISLNDGGAGGNFTVATVHNPTFTTSVTTPLLQSSGVLTLTSASGQVLAVDAGTTIELQDSTNVTGSVDISVALTVGTSDAFQVNSSGAIAAATGITSSGAVTFSALNCTTFTNGGKLTTNGSGQLTCANDTGAAANTITGSGANGTLPMFTATNVIANSIVTQSGTTVNIAGDLTLNTALAVAQGGTGAVSFTANGVLYGNNTGALQATAAGTGGQVLVANASGVPTFVSFSGDVLVSDTGVTTIQANSVALGTDTTGDYVANLGVLTGLTASGNSGEGSTPGLSVNYGSIANTAVQGNTQLTCPSGSGNLTGGGTVITLGTGGTCGALDTVASPNFATSVTTPLIQSGGALAITPGGALTVGATGQVFTLQGNASSTITATGLDGFLTQVGFTGTATGALTYQFDRAAAPGTYTICTTVGNCNGPASTLQSAYANSVGGTTPEIKLGATRIGLDIQDADVSLGSGENFMAFRAPNASGLGSILVGFGLQGNLYMTPSTDRVDLVDVNDTNGNNVFTVDSQNKRVGINLGGSTLPSYALDVRGTLAVTQPLNNDTAIFSTTNTSGTATNGLLVNRNGAGGATTNGISITNTAGTLTNGLTFSGTIGTDIYRQSGTLSVISGNSVSIQAGSSASISIGTANTNSITIGSTSSNTAVNILAGTGASAGVNIGGVGSLGLSSIVNIATGSTTSQTVAIGSNVGSSTTTIQGGSGNINLTVNQSGAGVVVRTATNNSATALQVQDSSSAAILTADTVSGLVKVGSTTTDASARLLVLDSYNGANESGFTAGQNVDGAMYYNTNTGKFRCRQAGVWADCVTASGGLVSLQNAYTNSTGGTTPEIVLDTTRGAVTIRDAVSPIGANLFEVQNNAGSATYLGVTTTGISVTGSAAVSTSVLTPALDTISAGALSIGGSTATSIVIGNTANNTAITLQSGTGAINIGATAHARTVNLGTGAANQTVTVGSLTGGSTTTIQGGTGNINLNVTQANAGVIVRTVTNDSSSAFQVQRSDGNTILSVDTASGWVINNGSTHPGNLIENPSFEGGTGFTASGWNFGGQSVITTDSTNARSGNKMLATTPNGTLLVLSSYKYLAVTPGDQFYAEIWYKTAVGTDGGSNGGSFSLTYYDKDKVNIGSSSVTNFNAANNSYTRGTVSGTVPAGAVYLRLSIAVNSTSTTGTWYMDDFYLAKTSQQAPAIFRNSVDSAAAFVIQNASIGETLFTADTRTRTGGSAGNVLKIGDSTGTDTSLTVLQLDSTTANPTTNLASLNGGLFYNSTTGKISLIENGQVKVICNTTDLGCGTGTITLQTAYNNSTNPEIILDGTRGALTVRDSSTPLGANLLEIQNNAGTTTYLSVASTGLSVNTALSAGAGGVGNSITSNVSTTGGMVTGNRLDTALSPASNSSADVIGTSNTITTSGSANFSGDLIASLGQVNWAGTGTSSDRLIGSVGKVAASGSSGAIQTAVGIMAEGQFQGGAVTNYYGLYSTMNSLNSVGIQNAYGLKIDNFAALGSAAPTNFYAIAADGGMTRLTGSSAYQFQIQNAALNPVLNVDTTTVNLVTNPSIELDTNGWSASGGATLSQSTAITPYDGNFALRVNAAATVGSGTRFAYNLAGSTQYTLSFFAKSAPGDSFGTIQAGRSDNGSTDTPCTLDPNPAGFGAGVNDLYWKRYSCTFTTGSVSGSRYIYIKQTDATARTFYIDAVQLEAGSTATLYRSGKTSISGSLVVNGGQPEADASNVTLKVNVLAGGHGLIIKGSGYNDLFKSLIDIRNADDTISYLNVNEVTRGTSIRGGNSAFSAAALEVTSLQDSAVALKLNAASGQTADVFQIYDAAGTPNKLLGVGVNAIAIGNATTNTALSLQSGTGTIDIGTGAQARAINIGTGTASQAVTIGSQNTTSNTTIQGGTNGITLQTSGTTLVTSSAPGLPTMRIQQTANSTTGGRGLLIVGGLNPGENVFEVQNSSSTPIFSIDSSNSRTTIGSGTTCTGRLCVGQTSGGSGLTGNVTTTNLYNVQNVNVSLTSGTRTYVGQNIVINDTSTAQSTVLQPLVIDTTGSTNASAQVNAIQVQGRAGATGTFIQLQNGSTDVLNINNTGATTFRMVSGNDSATAFRIQDGAGASMFTVDTATRGASGGNLIKIGNSTGTNGAVTILQLDSTTSDPTSNLSALNGGLFYNSTTGKVSLIEDGQVKVICNTTDLGCGTGTITQQMAYTNSAGSTTPEIIVDSTRGGFDIQDANTTIGSSQALFAVRGSATSTTLGTPYLQVIGDGRVQIGSVTADSSQYNLVVDTSTATSDAAGVNGAIYYSTGGRGGAGGASSYAGKFRCYEGGAWKNCVGMRDIVERRWGYAVPVGVGSGVTALTGFGNAPTPSTTGSGFASAQTESNYVGYGTNGVSGNATGVAPTTTSTQGRYLPKLSTRVRIDAATNVRHWVALTSGSLTALNPVTSSASAGGLTYIGMSASSSFASGAWICGAADGINKSGTSTGVTMVAGHYYDIIIDASVSGQLVCSISDNGGAFTTVVHTSQVSGFSLSTTNLGMQATITALDTSLVNMYIAYLYQETN